MERIYFVKLIAVGFVALSGLSSYAIERNEPAKPIVIEASPAKCDRRLCIVEGELRFVTDRLRVPANAPPLPDYSLRFYRDKDFLRASVKKPYVEDNAPKELLEKDGYYVTADYKTTPPKVILTKEPTKYSRWSLIPEGGLDCYYLKSVNDIGKDAWLSMVEEVAKRYYTAESRVPILSYEKKGDYFLDDANSGK